MVASEEAGRLLQDSPRLRPANEVTNGNPSDCSDSAVFARWRRLGILSLAPLDRATVRRTDVFRSTYFGERSSHCYVAASVGCDENGAAPRTMSDETQVRRTRIGLPMTESCGL
jgi:hypothetical protein